MRKVGWRLLDGKTTENGFRRMLESPPYFQVYVLYYVLPSITHGRSTLFIVIRESVII